MTAPLPQMPSSLLELLGMGLGWLWGHKGSSLIPAEFRCLFHIMPRFCPSVWARVTAMAPMLSYLGWGRWSTNMSTSLQKVQGSCP